MAKKSEEMFDIRPLASRAEQERIPGMESSTVIRFSDRRTRDNRISRAMDAMRRLAEVERDEAAAPGRAWINGIEVGGTDRRFAHLSVFHD
jgi:hypothetical protein